MGAFFAEADIKVDWGPSTDLRGFFRSTVIDSDFGYFEARRNKVNLTTDCGADGPSYPKNFSDFHSPRDGWIYFCYIA